MTYDILIFSIDNFQLWFVNKSIGLLIKTHLHAPMKIVHATIDYLTKISFRNLQPKKTCKDKEIKKLTNSVNDCFVNNNLIFQSK